MANFDEIVAELRTAGYVVVNTSSRYYNESFSYASYSNSKVVAEQMIVPEDATHFQIQCHDPVAKKINYSVLNFESRCAELTADLAMFYDVEAVYISKPGMQYMDVCYEWLEKFRKKHVHEEWTHLELFYDERNCRIGYIGFAVVNGQSTYETITLSCAHLAYAKARFCGDQLPRCPCALPRNIQLAWTQRETDHKIVGVRVLTGYQHFVCMECGEQDQDSLAFVRNPLALVLKDKPESGVYCTPCYEKMRAQLIDLFPK